MRYTRLGKTDLEISEVGFGCIPIIRLSTENAVTVLRRAFEKGITFYDTANAYLDSEEKIGQTFSRMRDKVIIATKTLKRDRNGAQGDIELSLQRIGTDYIDLFQIHQLSQESDYEAVTGPNGALEAVLRAKEEGKIRYIGVTSHSLEMAVKLAKTGLFSTIQFPFNFIESAPTQELHPCAREAGMGILAMKPFCGGVVDNAQVAFKFLRQFSDVIPLPGFDAVGQVDEVVGFYDKENSVSPDDLAIMEKYRTELGNRFCRRCEYCQPCPEGVMITAAMGYPIIAHRMSPAKAAGFATKAMESVINCIDCGECAERCPYDLPIPEMLKDHQAMYEKHKAGK